MSLDDKMVSTEAVPLRMAVLCVDCECVTRGLSDQCVVCGSHSLLGLERLLGGSQVLQRPRQAKSPASIDVDIEIALREVEPHVLNAVVEAMSNLLAPSVISGRARIHLTVEPVAARSRAEIAQAA